MKSKLPILVALLLAATLLMGANEPPKPKLPMVDAQKIAVNNVPGTVENQDLLIKGGHTDYSFDIQSAKELREVVVNGDDGKVISNKSETKAALEAKKKRKKTGTSLNGVTISGATVQ